MFRAIGLPELLMMGCIGLIVLGGLGVALRAVRTGSGRRQPCPYCAELILVDARVCRFCGRDLI